MLVATAVTVQPGYTGSLTLELINEGDIPFMRDCGRACASPNWWWSRWTKRTSHPYSKGYARAIGPENRQAGMGQERGEHICWLGKGLSMGR